MRNILIKSNRINLVAAAVVAGAMVMPANAAEKVSARIATAGLGGSWYVYGAGMADLVKTKLQPGSSFDVLPIAGAIGNIKLVQKGEAEFGLSFPMPSAESCKGYGAFKTKQDKVRGVMGGLDVFYFGTFVTTKSGAMSWSDIAAAKNGFRLLTANIGGTGENGVRQVLALLDSGKKKVKAKGGSVKVIARAQTASAISDGKADGWAHVVTRGHPAATQLTTTNDMRMLGLPDNVIKGMISKHGWIAATVPANTFKGQTEAVKTVKAATNVLASADVPDEVVYTFTKTVMENAARVRKMHSGLSKFDPKSAVAPGLVGNCPFHPGAVKYYKEAGLM